MPTDLAGLLVEEGTIAADAMERALVRQRVAGGALDTALLELGCVREDVLLDALSRASGLPAPPPAAFQGADARARRVFPSRVAERHGLAPFALTDRELSLMAVHPVDLALLDEISFMLSLHLTAHVAPEWRVRTLIHELYGTPLPSRLAAVAAAHAARAAERAPAPGDDAAAVADEAIEAPEAIGASGERRGAGGLDGTDGADALAAAVAPGSELAAPAGGPDAERVAGDADARGDGADPGALLDPAPAGSVEPIGEALARALEAELFPGEPLGAPSEPGSDAAFLAQGEDARPFAPAEDVGGEMQREPEEAPSLAPPALDPGAPPGWTLDEARAALDAAAERDEAVRVALRFARDFFEFAALFVVARDAVAGHDALGPDGDDARELCRTVALYASEPGLFQQALDTRALHVGPMPRDATGNAAVLDGLGRGEPRTVLVYPVFVRDRPVCLLYADNGPAAVSYDRLSGLLRLLAGLGPAFERLIHDRKRRRVADEEGAEAAPEVATPPAPVAAAAPEPSPGPAAAVREVAEPFVATVAPEPPFRPRPPPQRPAPPAPPPREPDPWQAFEPGAALRDLEVDVELDPAAWPELGAPPPRFDPEAEVTALLATPAGSDGREAALARLAEHAVESLPVLWARLPGPLESEADDATPDALGPLPAALAALGGAALPAMLDVLRDPDPGRRRVAVAVLGASGDPAAFPALADRALDPDPRVAAAAAAALAAHRRDPAMRVVPERLRRALLSGVSARAASAARALGALRDADAVPLLVQVLDGSEREPAAAAADALARITLQRHGADPRRWIAWWRENRGRGRAEWLLSGLTSAEREVRVQAAAELAGAAPAPIPYSADAPAPERERAARAWAGWWARSGHFI